MGVCSIQSNREQENLLAVGSYDEHVRLFDTRSLRRPLSETRLGGGIWRVKWDPFGTGKILTASMHNGFHVVDGRDINTEPLPVLAHYDHQTPVGCLGYGADWCRLRPTKSSASKELNQSASAESDQSSQDNFTKKTPELTQNNPSEGQARLNRNELDSFLIGTCSFYDNSLQFWKFDA